MGLSAELVPPPAVTLDSDGPVGAAIIEATQRHLGPSAPGAAPGGARPVIVMVEPGTAAVAELVDRLTVATQPRGQRVWVVVTEASQVPGVDSVVETITGVDSIVLVDNSHPATAGAALAAWTWLRHDAPSMALGTLRDSTGRVCRVASITAQVPAEPPYADASPPLASAERPKQLLAQGSATAVTAGGVAAEELLSTAEVTRVVGGIDAAVDSGVDPAALDLLESVSEWNPSELGQLRAAVEALAASTVADESALTAATVALSGADAALTAETARTGLGSMFGRRKRLSTLATARDEAWYRWRSAVTAHAERRAQHRFAQTVATSLPELITNSESRWQQAIHDRADQALNRWLETTVASAERLEPSLPPTTLPVSRTWGDARPEVRRHLLVPAAAKASAQPVAGPVTVHGAAGLERPLALAWLLGLSASSFETAEVGTD